MNYEDLPEEEALSQILNNQNYLKGEVLRISNALDLAAECNAATAGEINALHEELSHVRGEERRLHSIIENMLEAEVYRQGAISNDCSPRYSELDEFGDLLEPEYAPLRFDDE